MTMTRVGSQGGYNNGGYNNVGKTGKQLLEVLSFSPDAAGRYRAGLRPGRLDGQGSPDVQAPGRYLPERHVHGRRPPRLHDGLRRRVQHVLDEAPAPRHGVPRRGVPRHGSRRGPAHADGRAALSPGCGDGRRPDAAGEPAAPEHRRPDRQGDHRQRFPGPPLQEPHASPDPLLGPLRRQPPAAGGAGQGRGAGDLRPGGRHAEAGEHHYVLRAGRTGRLLCRPRRGLRAEPPGHLSPLHGDLPRDDPRLLLRRLHPLLRLGGRAQGAGDLLEEHPARRHDRVGDPEQHRHPAREPGGGPQDRDTGRHR